MDRAQRSSSPVLIGRESELAQLLAAAGSRPSLVIVSGEAGIGKTRLVLECGRAVQGRRMLVGRCPRLREPFMLGPIVEALRGLADGPPADRLSPVTGALGPLLPELAPYLPPPLAPLGDASSERHRVFRAMREALGAWGPAVCVLEDLHWADETTLDFLSFLVSEPHENLALVLTYREHEIESSSRLAALASRRSPVLCPVTVELGALTLEHTAELVAALLPTEAVPPALARRVHDRTSGIPLAIEEVIWLLADRLGAVTGAHGWADGAVEALAVPSSIRHLILDRMRSLSPDARLVLGAAAVLAVPATEALIVRVAGLSAIRGQRALNRALRAALLNEGPTGVYGFRHALAAQAVYEDVQGPERRRLHARAARALDSGAQRPAAQLARHYRCAGQADPWIRHGEAAADLASAAGDDPAAARWLEEVLASRPLARAARIRLACKLGKAALHSTSPRPAIGLIQRTLDEEPVGAGVRGELRFSLSRLLYHAGDADSARPQLLQAVEELRRRPQLEVHAMINMALTVLRDRGQGDPEAWLRRAADVAARQGDRGLRTAVLAQRAAILLCAGDPAGWAEVSALPTDGKSVGEKLALLRGYHSLSEAALGLGHHARAESFLADAERLQHELHRVSWTPWLRSARVAIDWRLGRWPGLERRARELIDATQGTHVLLLSSHTILGSLLFSQGQLDEAERSFISALEIARCASLVGPFIARGRLAALRLARGDVESACSIAAEGLALVRGKGIWAWATNIAPVAAEAMVASGDPAAARGLVEEFAAGLRGRDAPAADAALALCRATVATADRLNDDAARLCDRAERIWQRLPCPHEAAGARERRARCLLADGEERGASLLVGALRSFEALGASWDVARVLAELRSAGVALPYPWRGGRRAYGSELSPREVQVERLAAGGRTNRQIAEALFISQRTAEGHVAAVLRKRGLASRHALVAGGQPAGLTKSGTPTR